jgi:hypothetical protein
VKRKFQQFSILAVLVVFLFSFAPDIVESRRGGFGGGRSFSRSRSSSRRSYSAPKRSSSSTSRSSTRTTRSTGSTYSKNGASRTTGTRASTTARQKQTATSRAKATTATNRSTTATRGQQRPTTAQNRKQVRQLKTQNRSLKRQVRTSNRQTARARRDRRSTVNINNYGGYYPMMGYSMYSMSASMAFNNIMFGIYFHDHYNHAIRHSYMWHYHHRNYDRSHWDAEKQAEYERYKDYYESQGIESNSNYVDPGTNPDENYVASYVEENPDKFYGDGAEVFTVEELPDEEALKQELLASAEDTPTVTATTAITTSTRAPPATRTVVEKKTSGATWFLLIFGSLLVVGVIMMVMYNKGYF